MSSPAPRLHPILRLARTNTTLEESPTDHLPSRLSSALHRPSSFMRQPPSTPRLESAPLRQRPGPFLKDASWAVRHDTMSTAMNDAGEKEEQRQSRRQPLAQMVSSPAICPGVPCRDWCAPPPVSLQDDGRERPQGWTAPASPLVTPWENSRSASPSSVECISDTGGGGSEPRAGD